MDRAARVLDPRADEEAREVGAPAVELADLRAAHDLADVELLGDESDGVDRLRRTDGRHRLGMAEAVPPVRPPQAVYAIALVAQQLYVREVMRGAPAVELADLRAAHDLADVELLGDESDGVDRLRRTDGRHRLGHAEGGRPEREETARRRERAHARLDGALGLVAADRARGLEIERARLLRGHGRLARHVEGPDRVAERRLGERPRGRREEGPLDVHDERVHHVAEDAVELLALASAPRLGALSEGGPGPGDAAALEAEGGLLRGLPVLAEEDLDEPLRIRVDILGLGCLGGVPPPRAGRGRILSRDPAGEDPAEDQSDHGQGSRAPDHLHLEVRVT